MELSSKAELEKIASLPTTIPIWPWQILLLSLQPPLFKTPVHNSMPSDSSSTYIASLNDNADSIVGSALHILTLLPRCPSRSVDYMVSLKQAHLLFVLLWALQTSLPMPTSKFIPRVASHDVEQEGPLLVQKKQEEEQAKGVNYVYKAGLSFTLPKPLLLERHLHKAGPHQVLFENP
jgi:hypothetical protein